MNNNNNDFGYNDDPVLDLKRDFNKINANIDGNSREHLSVDKKSILSIDDIKTTNKQIRLSNKDVDTLTKHFETKGLKFATGVRMVLVQYIRENGLS